MSHAVHDSASKERQVALGQIESHRDLTRVAFEAAHKTSSFIDENEIDNIERQSGQRMSITEFERRVQKICPDIRFRSNFLTDEQARFLHLAPGSTTRRMLHLRPDGSLVDLAGFQNQAMLPEYTIVLTRPKRVPVNIDRFKHIKAADGSWVKVPFIPGGDIPKATPLDDGQFKFNGPKPGERVLKEPAGTLVGWRTLVARLGPRGYNLVTTDAIECEFGTSDRASWAVRMGKRDLPLEI